MLQDLRDAGHALVRDIRFTALAVTVLAVTIGATTAVYAVVQAIIVRPFPFADQDRLAVIWQRDLRRDLPVMEVAYGEMTDWRARSRAFEDLAVVGSVNWSITLAGVTEDEQLPMAAVSASFFPVIGTAPALGGGFSPEDEIGSAAGVMVISHGLWTRRFGQDRGIVGRVVQVREDAEGRVVPIQVVGVMPAGFDYPRGTDVWMPAAPLVRKTAVHFEIESEAAALKWLRVFYVVGRVRHNVTLETAAHELTEVMRTADMAGGPEPPLDVVATPIASYLIGPAKPVLWTLLAGAVLMLVIASVNVAGLQVSRAAHKERALAIRAALGASNLHLLRQTLLESAMVTAVAGVGAVVIAFATVRTLLALAPVDVPRLDSVALISVPVLVFGTVAALATLVLCGVSPAVQASRLDASRVLVHSSSAGANPRGRRMQRTIVVAQIAIALTLMAGTGLFLRTVQGLDRTVLGFDPDHLLAVSVTPATDDQDRWNAFYDALIARVEALPDVTRAGGVYLRPLSGPIGWDSQPIHRGQDPENPAAWGLNPMLNLEVVTPGYFQAMGIRLVRGRLFGEHDTETAPGAVIVSESAARRLWPGRDAVGQQLRDGSYRVKDSPSAMKWQTVIGVVDDVRYRGLNDVRLDLYLPATQSTNRVQHLMVRTAGSRAGVAASIRDAARTIDPRASVSEATIMSEVIAAESSPWRFLVRIFVSFAVVAAVLTAIGLGAVITLAVASRRRELAIRAALGAGRAQLQATVLREGLWIVMVGAVLGSLGAAALGRSTASILVGVRPHDPVALGTALLLAVSIGILAIWLPARRAAQADPIEALKAE